MDAERRKEIIEKACENILEKWFVITPDDGDGGDVWGMDTSLGTIEQVKDMIREQLSPFFDLTEKAIAEEIFKAIDYLTTRESMGKKTMNDYYDSFFISWDELKKLKKKYLGEGK